MSENTLDPLPKTGSKDRKIWKLLILFATTGLLLWFVYMLSPYLIDGVTNYKAYLFPDWAHNSQNLKSLLQFCLALWLLFTAVFFSFWLIRRVIRLMQGKTWRVEFRDKHLHFFPNVLLYLKLSCAYLALAWLFVVAQYPIQFFKV